MAKVEVQIRQCFCCGLSLSSLLIAIYTLVSLVLQDLFEKHKLILRANRCSFYSVQKTY